jgi:hypothetical protein
MMEPIISLATISIATSCSLPAVVRIRAGPSSHHGAYNRSGATFHPEPAVCLILPSIPSQQSVWSKLPSRASSLSGANFHPEPKVCLERTSILSQISVWSELPYRASSLSGANLHPEPAACLILPSTWSQQPV